MNTNLSRCIMNIRKDIINDPEVLQEYVQDFENIGLYIYDILLDILSGKMSASTETQVEAEKILWDVFKYVPKKKLLILNFIKNMNFIDSRYITCSWVKLFTQELDNYNELMTFLGHLAKKLGPQCIVANNNVELLVQKICTSEQFKKNELLDILQTTSCLHLAISCLLVMLNRFNIAPTRELILNLYNEVVANHKPGFICSLDRLLDCIYRKIKKKEIQPILVLDDFAQIVQNKNCQNNFYYNSLGILRLLGLVNNKMEAITILRDCFPWTKIRTSNSSDASALVCLTMACEARDVHVYTHKNGQVLDMFFSYFGDLFDPPKIKDIITRYLGHITAEYYTGQSK